MRAGGLVWSVVGLWLLSAGLLSMRLLLSRSAEPLRRAVGIEQLHHVSAEKLAFLVVAEQSMLEKYMTVLHSYGALTLSLFGVSVVFAIGATWTLFWGRRQNGRDGN
jgi:hypothetical protein